MTDLPIAPGEYQHVGKLKEVECEQNANVNITLLPIFIIVCNFFVTVT